MNKKIRLRQFFIFSLTIITLSFFCFAGKEKQGFAFSIIPKQQFDIWKVMGVADKHDTVSVDSFEISSFVTFGEYKKYLEAVKKDSSEKFYRSQFPDSSMCTKEAYVKYVNGSAYDNLPVSGISWDNAMNFCKWKTIMNNPKDSFSIVYRLPEVSEWASAYKYFNDHSIKNDMNKNYSDWTMRAHDESSFDYYKSLSKKKGEAIGFDYDYFALTSDPPVMKRKNAIGNSFHHTRPNLYGFFSEYYYEFHGYSFISFRVVKKKVQPLIAGEYFYNNWDVDHECLKNWGLVKYTRKFKTRNYHGKQ